MAGWLFSTGGSTSSLPAGGSILDYSAGGSSGSQLMSISELRRRREARESAARDAREQAERAALRQQMVELQEKSLEGDGDSWFRKLDRAVSAPLYNLFADDDDRVGFLTDIVPRTFDGVKETVLGLPRAAIEVGHDIGKAVNEPLERLGITESEDDEFASDDIARAVIEDYKYRYWSPFSEEGFGKDGWMEFGKRAYDDPLAPMLDALALRAGAAGVGGRIAAQAARSGSTRAARVAGLERRAVKDVAEELGIDVEAATAEEVASYFTSPHSSSRGNRAETIKGNADEVLIPRRRTIQVGGDTVDLGMVARNPSIRGNREAYDRFSERTRLPIVNAVDRTSRINRVRADTRANREARESGLDAIASRLLRPGQMQALRKNPQAQAAIVNAIQGVENETAAAAVRAKLEEVRAMDGHAADLFQRTREELGALQREAGRGKLAPEMVQQTAEARAQVFRERADARRKEAERVEQRLEELAESEEEMFAVGGSGFERRPVADGPEPNVSYTTRFAPSFQAFSRGVDDGIARVQGGATDDLGEAVADAIDDNLRTPRRQPRMLDREAYEAYLEGRLEDLNRLARIDTQRATALSRVAEDGDLEFVYERARTMEFAAKHQGLVIESLEQRNRVLTDLLENGLVPKDQALVNSLVEMFRETGDEIAVLLREAQESAGLEPTDTVGARTLPQRLAGVEDINEDVGWFPQQVRPGRSQSAVSSFGNVAKPGSARRRTGLSEELALNALEPENFMRQARSIIEWRRNLDLHQAMRRTFREWPADQDLPPGYVDVSSKAVRDRLAMAHDLLDEVSVFVPDEMDFADIKQRVLGDVDERLAAGQRLIAPKGVVDRYTKELAASDVARNQLLRSFDSATGVWRFLTLNARPAWMVNNIVGQTVLMAMSYSTYSNIRSTLAYLADPETRAMVRHYSGGVDMQGSTRVLTGETRKMIGSDSFLTRRLQALGLRSTELVDLLGGVQAAISDDWARRLAMVNELRPGAERLAKARGISKREAMEEMLGNEQVLARVEEAVLGDLINFADLTPRERAVLRRVAPFYSWLKGMSKRTFAFGASQPGKTLAWAQVGQAGSQMQEEDFGGPVPDFVFGSILGGETEGGRRSAFVTQAANPLQTPVDVAGMLMAPFQQGATPGENPLSTFNPIIKAGGETVANRDFFTGDTVHEPGESWLETFTRRLATSTPYTQSAERYIDWLGMSDLERQQRNQNALYYYSPGNELVKHLGVPYRDMNVRRALEIGDTPRVYASAPVVSASNPAGGQSYVGPDGLLYYTRPYDIPN